MRIVICEDNAVQREEIRKMLGKIFFEEEDVDIRCFEDGEELIWAMENEAEFYADIIFLDVKMPRLDGVQTAKAIRKKKKPVAIVFLTAHSEYVFMGYEVHAYDYILKPASESKLRKVIFRFMEEQKGEDQRHLLVTKRGGKKKIPLDKVSYFVSDKRKITAVLEETLESVDFYMTMKELEDCLREMPFLRCHQSYLVNMHRITDWNRNSLVTEGKNRIPVSKRYRDVVERALRRQYENRSN